jgi:type I restriction enzyme S subunit
MLEEMAEEIYKEWFVRMRFPATADTPGYQDCKFFDQEGNEVAYGTVGALPEGWEEVELENIVQVSDGTHDSPKRTNKGHYLVTGKNIKNRFIDTSGCYHISSEDHQKIQKRSYLNIGDVIVSNIGTVGNLAYIFEKPDYSVKNVIILRALNRDHSSYIFQFMESENTQATFQNEMTGASQQFLSLSYMRKLKVLKPHEQVLKAFDVYVSQILKLTFFLYKKNQVLQETRDLLLPRLINGKLDVSKLSLSKYDNDNPENLSMAAEPEGTYHAFNESDK